MTALPRDYGGIEARPTTYNGIEMRSRLEASFAAWLDRNHMEWKYEGRAWASEHGQCLPDFELFNLPTSMLLGEHDRRDSRHFVEIKPKLAMVNEAVRRHSVLWRSEPDALISVVVPHEMWHTFTRELWEGYQGERFFGTYPVNYESKTGWDPWLGMMKPQWRGVE